MSCSCGKLAEGDAGVQPEGRAVVAGAVSDMVPEGIHQEARRDGAAGGDVQNGERPAAFEKYYFETHVPMARKIAGLRN
jgi:hypothetical protein